MTNEHIEFEEWYSIVIDIVALGRPGFIVDYATARGDYDLGLTTYASANIFINQKEQ